MKLIWRVENRERKKGRKGNVCINADRISKRKQNWKAGRNKEKTGMQEWTKENLIMLIDLFEERQNLETRMSRNADRNA